MPVIRTCHSTLAPKTPRRTRISISLVSPGADKTRPNTPESPVVYVQRNRALRRDPSLFFPPSTIPRYPSLSHEDNEETAGVAPMPEQHLYAGIAVENKAEDARDDFNVVIISSPVVGSVTASAPAVDNSAAVNDIDPTIVPTFQPPLAPVPQSETSLLLQLETFSGPGLSEEQFLSLIARCHVCRRYTTRRTIKYHDCGGMNPVSEDK